MTQSINSILSDYALFARIAAVKQKCADELAPLLAQLSQEAAMVFGISPRVPSPKPVSARVRAEEPTAARYQVAERKELKPYRLKETSLASRLLSAMRENPSPHGHTGRQLLALLGINDTLGNRHSVAVALHSGDGKRWGRTGFVLPGKSVGRKPFYYKPLDEAK